MSNVGNSQNVAALNQVKTDSAAVKTTTPETGTSVDTTKIASDKLTSDAKVGTIPAINIDMREIIKKPIAGVAIGVGGVGAVTAIAKAANSAEGLKQLITMGPKPNMSATISAGLIGAGGGLLLMDANDQASKELKNHAGAAILGAGAGGVVSSIARALFTADDAVTITNSSPSVMVYSGLIGLGVSLMNTNSEDKDTKLMYNAAAGTLIGTGAAGIGGAAIRSLAASDLRMSTVSVITLGALAGLGIGIAASK
jgi:hypothetical protein